MNQHILVSLSQQPDGWYVATLSYPDGSEAMELAKVWSGVSGRLPVVAEAFVKFAEVIVREMARRERPGTSVRVFRLPSGEQN